jgi:hypothetical protein
MNDVIAIAEAAPSLALFDTAPHAAMGLGGEVFQKQGIHRAFQADMQLVDRPFCEGNDLDACELQMLVERRNIRLIARQAVQRFGQHDVELSRQRILQKLLDARTERYRRTGQCRIFVCRDDLPAFAFGLFAADTKLILNRRGVLVVGGVAGVERDLGHRIVSPTWWGGSQRPCLSCSGKAASTAVVVRPRPFGQKVPRHAPTNSCRDQQDFRLRSGERWPTILVRWNPAFIPPPFPSLPHSQTSCLRSGFTVGHRVEIKHPASAALRTL